MKAIAAITVGCLSLASCSTVKHMNADDWGRLVDLGQRIIQDARALGADTEEVKAAIDEVKAREEAREKAVANGEAVPAVETIKWHRDMYYEYLQEMGRQYGMQKRAGISDAGVRATKAVLSGKPQIRGVSDEFYQRAIDDLKNSSTVLDDVGFFTRLFGGKKLLDAANKHYTVMNKHFGALSDSFLYDRLAKDPAFRANRAELKARADSLADEARSMALKAKNETIMEYGDALDSARRRMTITAGGLGAGGLASLPLALSEKSASMRKQAGDVDTWGGNAVSALVPFGTIDKVNDRGEGVGGFLTRNTMHGVGSGLGVGAGLLPFVPSVNREIDKAVAAGLSPADIATKAPKLRKLMLGAMLSGTALGVGGAVVGDRVADKML